MTCDYTGGSYDFRALFFTLHSSILFYGDLHQMTYIVETCICFFFSIVTSVVVLRNREKSAKSSYLTMWVGKKNAGPFRLSGFTPKVSFLAHAPPQSTKFEENRFTTFCVTLLTARQLAHKTRPSWWRKHGLPVKMGPVKTNVIDSPRVPLWHLFVQVLKVNSRWPQMMGNFAVLMLRNLKCVYFKWAEPCL